MKRKLIRSIIFYAVAFLSSAAYAQKPLIDSNAYKKWVSLGWGTIISNDGNYVLYTVVNKPVGKSTLVIKGLNNGWRREIQTPNGSFSRLTADSKRAVVPLANDSLAIILLGSQQVDYLASVSSFKLSTAEKTNWLAYQTILNNELTLLNLNSNDRKVFSHVQDYMFCENGKQLILKTISPDVTPAIDSLKVFNTAASSTHTVYTGSLIQSIILNPNGSNVAFLSSSQDRAGKSIWMFKPADRSAKEISPDWLNCRPGGLYIEGLKNFTQDGSGILVSLKDVSPAPKQREATGGLVTIWSYSDTKLQSQQLKELQKEPSYTAILKIGDKTLTRIENSNENIEQSTFNQHLGEVHLIIGTSGDAGIDENNWNSAAETTWYLYTSGNNKRITLEKLKNYPTGSIKISSDGAFIVYYDQELKNFISYDIMTGASINITGKISTSWLEVNRNDLPNAYNTPRGIAGWLKKQQAVLIYDQYDLWLVDLKGKKRPVNITNGYGFQHHIRFNIEKPESVADYSDENHLILNAFNTINKDNGYFRIRLMKSGTPELLTMGPYLYNLTNNPYIQSNGSFPAIRAKDKEVYIIRRMSEKESPNLFSTSDFREFTPLSDIHPERDYNWFSTELHSWQLPNGGTSQGILYKPENFDPNKKYPVIFYYYERKSDNLHYFQQPEYLIGGCNINIATYVSNGYLVFSPDIYYTVGDPMQGTYDAVVSAAETISKLPFVDPSKFGIQGCSFGGIQTNYLITHTNLFSAAVSAASVADFISASGDIRGDGSALRGVYELGATRMGYSLWERPDLYIKNSAIFAADKVTTPLLMMQAKEDGICPFSNALEFFTSLRRLGKTAWLLEYSEGKHGVGGRSAVDFSIRMKQFFDYYLKDKPAPIWMTRGIPARKKGIETGLELDTLIKTPVPGLLTQKPKYQ